MVIWYSQEHRMFFENWKVHWLRESQTCWVWTLSAWWYSDLWWNLFLLLPGFRCSKYRSFCWLTLREWKLCKWQKKTYQNLRSLDISVGDCVLKFYLSSEQWSAKRLNAVQLMLLFLKKLSSGLTMDLVLTASQYLVYFMRTLKCMISLWLIHSS